MNKRRCVRTGVGVCVEGVDRVIFSRDVYDVVKAMSRKGHVRDVQRLRVHLTVYVVAEKLPKRSLAGRRPQLRDRERTLATIPTCACCVVVLCWVRMLYSHGGTRRAHD